MPKEVKNPQCCVPQCEKPIDKEYWNSQWLNNRTGWDVGNASPAIITYMAQYANKDAAILIPGCGNAHEAEFLVANGFTNITLIDMVWTCAAFAILGLSAIKPSLEEVLQTMPSIFTTRP